MGSAVANAIENQSSGASWFSDRRIEQVAGGTSNDIANWVRETTAERGVVVLRDALDVLAKAVSRLSDAEVDLDQVEELLVALRGAGILSSFQSGLLQIHYLRQLHNLQ